MSKVLRLFFLWVRYTLYGSWYAAFGWARGVSAIVLAGVGLPRVVTQHLPYWLVGLFDSQAPARNVLVSIGVAVLIGMIFHALVLAPRKAWWTVHPIELKIKNQTSSPEMVQDLLEKHQVWVVIKNRSPLKSLHYTLSILQDPEKYSDRHPWEVHSGDIPPEDEHNVVLANWFFGGPHGKNGKITIFSSRAGAFASANIIQLPYEGAVVCLLVRAKNYPDKQAWCRLFVNPLENRLILKNHG